MKNSLIIISGPPCTGKTTFGNLLADKLQVPLFNKDSFKEILFDDLGWSDRETSKKYGIASYGLLYYVIENELKFNRSLIIDSNFKSEFDTPKFNKLKEKYDFNIIQLIFKCDGEVLFKRFKKRSESNERHPGHVDSNNYEEFKEQLLSGQSEPLSVSSDIIEINTTDFTKIDNEKIIKEINNKIKD